MAFDQRRYRLPHRQLLFSVPVNCHVVLLRHPLPRRSQANATQPSHASGDSATHFTGFRFTAGHQDGPRQTHRMPIEQHHQASPSVAVLLEDEEDDLVTGPLDTMLKSLPKQHPKTPRRSQTTDLSVTPRGPRPVPAPCRARRLIEELPFAESTGGSPWLTPLERAEQVIQASKQSTRQVQEKRRRRSEAAC